MCSGGGKCRISIHVHVHVQLTMEDSTWQLALNHWKDDLHVHVLPG